jgi:hypothetical protein
MMWYLYIRSGNIALLQHWVPQRSVYQSDVIAMTVGEPLLSMIQSGSKELKRSV